MGFNSAFKGLIFKLTRNFIDKNEISLDTKDLISHCIFISNKILDQTGDGLEKRPKHVVVPKVPFVNKTA